MPFPPIKKPAEPVRETDHSEIILYILRKHAGEVLTFFKVPTIVETNINGDPKLVSVPALVRQQMRAEIGKSLSALIRQRRVVRYSHRNIEKGVREVGVRINEAFV